MGKSEKRTEGGFVRIKTLAQVRRLLATYIRDTAELNELLGQRTELKPHELDLAISIAIDEFNTMPPWIGEYVAIENFPSLTYLLRAAALEALRMAATWRARERLVYHDRGGESIDEHADKDRRYMDFVRFLKAEVTDMRDRIKEAYSISGGWGGVGSSYGMYYYSEQ